MKRTEVAQGFQQREPWVTKFVIDGQAYGGHFDAAQDARITQFAAIFSEARTILELGSLEGGHSFGLARLPHVKRVLAIEGRASSIEKARFAQRLLRLSNVEFVEANLENANLETYGRFDAVFCVGLLYHLPEPWTLIARCARVSPRIFIWTHYAADDKTQEVNDYQGAWYSEKGLHDPLSGLSEASFWPTLESLKLILAERGFPYVRVIRDSPKHPHGPAVTLAASKTEISGLLNRKIMRNGMAGSDSPTADDPGVRSRDKSACSEDAARAMFQTPSGARSALYEKYEDQLAGLFKTRAERRINTGIDAVGCSVFVCFTIRSGSNLLAEWLERCGVMPRAREFFNIASIKRFVEERDIPTFGEFCQRLVVERSARGLFSAKVGLIQMMLLCDIGMVGDVFPRPRFIHIRRNDLLEQAISFCIADQTKAWTWDQRPQREPIFNRQAIARKMSGIAMVNTMFEEFFKINEIVPYCITYEAFVEEPQRTVDGIADWLGCPRGRVRVDQLSFRRQVDARSREWKQRFLRTEAGS